MAAGSTIGTIFKVTTWGESHGKAIGVVVDGCPAGLPLDESEEDIQKFLNRRKPGQSRFTTQRKEGDEVEILSGVFEGKTTGTPISMIVRNTDQRSRDYSNIASCFRPGHADYTFEEKYGFRDYRGGGRSSARETIGRVAAGAIAEKFLKQLNISVTAYAKSIGPVEVSPERMDLAEIQNNRFCLPDAEAAKAAEDYLVEMDYLILERNYRLKFGEIDIIAAKDGGLVFVEVKTRKSNLFGEPSEYVDRKKQERVKKAAMVYADVENTDMRFDVIEVFYEEKNGELFLVKVNHIENAF